LATRLAVDLSTVGVSPPTVERDRRACDVQMIARNSNTCIKMSHVCRLTRNTGYLCLFIQARRKGTIKKCHQTFVRISAKYRPTFTRDSLRSQIFKIHKKTYLGVQGRLRSSMFLPQESSSAVLVIISSKSVFTPEELVAAK